MLPISKNHKTPPELDRKNSFNSLNSILHNSLSLHHPRTWLFLFIFFLQILIFLTIRSFPLSFSHHRRHHNFPSPFTSPHHQNHQQQQQQLQLPAAEPGESDECGVTGRVFVYELPTAFNKQLLRECDNLNPWSSRCDALANDGFGKPATGIDGIVPRNLTPAWFWTDQFVSEIVFHNRILNHNCQTLEPESATAFYMPFYAGLAVGKYLWYN